MHIKIWENIVLEYLKLCFISIIDIGTHIENNEIWGMLIDIMMIVVLVNDCWFQVLFFNLKTRPNVK